MLSVTHQPAPKIVLIEKRRRNVNLAGYDKLFHHANELRQQIFLVAFPTRFHLIEDAARGLEGDLLPAKFFAEIFEIDLGKFRHVRFSLDDRSNFSQGRRFERVQLQRFNLSEIQF